MLRNRFFKAILVGVAASILGLNVAQAWDGIQTTVPGDIDVTDGGNYGFRVWGPTCGGVSSFAYLLATDSNYSTYVAVILMAKSQGITVTFYTTKDSNGYCHIGYISQS
jgi:hypothetical protein